jgi:phage terminase large subunit GpA-like protein
VTAYVSPEAASRLVTELRANLQGMPDGRRVLFEALIRATKPVDDLTISEWSDRFRKVSAESGSPWPGDFRTERTPYLREPQDCLHPDHPARRVTARWSAQLGKSTAIENWFCYVVDRAPGTMMIVMPTLDEAVKFNRVKLQPTIDATPKVRHKVRALNSRDEAASTAAFKRFGGGWCQIVNAGSSKGLQMVSIKYLAMDEVTGYPRDVDGRGSPRDQARARQKAYGDFAKEWQGSTPGIVGACAVSEDFEAGDRRHFYVPCPHCGAYQALEFENMRGPEGDSPAHFVCVSCLGRIVDGHKVDLLPAGVWIARRVAEGEEPVPIVIKPDDLDRWRAAPCEGRCRDWQPSYHLWSAYAPRERFGAIWQRWSEAQGNTTKMMVFYQQDLALPYDPSGVAVEHEKLMAALQSYPARRIPRQAAVVVSAADVQGYGIKWAAFAIGPGGRRWLIDREIFVGDPSASDDPWIALADALQRRYPAENGIERGIDLSGVDSGYATNRVYLFCASRPGCLALDGRKSLNDPRHPWLGTGKKVTAKGYRGNIVGKTVLYPVGNYDVKCEVVAAMANLVQGPDAAGQWPRNVYYLTSELCDADMALELTAERLVDVAEESRSANAKARNFVAPTDRREWRKIAGRANDWFDVSVYAFAIGWQLTNRWTPARWETELADVHGVEAPADLFSRPSPVERQDTSRRANDRSGKSLREIAKEKWKRT